MSDNPWAPPPAAPPAGRPQWGPPPPPPPQPWGTPPGPYSGYGWPAHQETFGGLPWPPYPPPLPPRRGFRGTTLALLIALVVVFVTAVGTAAYRAGPALFDEPADPERLARTRAELQVVLPDLQRFVERHRGLSFERPVAVELLPDDEFVDRLFEDDTAAVDPDAPPADGAATLFALGLVDDRDALDEVVDEAYADTVQGFYDHRTDELVIRGGELNPLTRLVLVHELVHALQDQHFGIDLDFADSDDESELAYRSLVEGDANRVDALYRLEMSRSERAELERLEQEQYGGVGGDTPDVVLALLAFPYELGPKFVEELIDAGGQAGLDAAFRKPPTTTEQILDARAYLRGEGATAVAAPKADGKVVDAGVLGHLGLALMLDDGGPGELFSETVDGWAGDRYVTWEAGDEVCTRATVAMETDRDAGELLAALLRTYDGAQVEPSGDRSFTLEVCEEE